MCRFALNIHGKKFIVRWAVKEKNIFSTFPLLIDHPKQGLRWWQFGGPSVILDSLSRVHFGVKINDTTTTGSRGSKERHPSNHHDKLDAQHQPGPTAAAAAGAISGRPRKVV